MRNFEKNETSKRDGRKALSNDDNYNYDKEGAVRKTKKRERKNERQQKRDKYDFFTGE